VVIGDDEIDVIKRQPLNGRLAVGRAGHPFKPKGMKHFSNRGPHRITIVDDENIELFKRCRHVWPPILLPEHIQILREQRIIPWLPLLTKIAP